MSFEDWLPHQRWYGGRQRVLSAVAIEGATPVDDDLEHVVLSVSYEDGVVESYQVFVAWDRPPADEFLGVATIGSFAGRTAYDALYTPLAEVVVGLVAAGGVRGDLAFVPEPDVAVPVKPPVRVVDAEQSNTSVVFDSAAILKVFRRVVPGANPDLELNRVLGRAGCPHVARLLGAIESPSWGSLGMVTAFAENAAGGWGMALASARDLFGEADLRADEVGGDFAAESHRLGEAVAVVHGCLASSLGTSSGSAPVDAWEARLSSAVAEVPSLASSVAAISAVYAATAPAGSVGVQRIHGDLHLGQVLRTPETWLLIDFEGEPGRPVAARRRPDSPLRDVAGMLRSYEYAAFQLLVGEPVEEQLTFRAREWVARNQDAFCDGYAAVAGFDPRASRALLTAYELDKAVYEAVYEARHRPSWAWIPLAAIGRLVDPAWTG